MDELVEQTTLLNKPKTKRKFSHRRGHPQTNPNSLANLIPYKKGQNGHQGNGYSMKLRLLHALDKTPQEPPADACWGDQIVYSTLKGAKELVPVAFREAWDRTEGKVPDKTLPATQVNVVFVIGRGYQPQLIEGADGNSDQA